MKTQPACPECEKLVKVSEESNKIGGFLEWLTGEEGAYICKWEEKYESFYTIYTGNNGINQVLAKYYNIDLDKVEQERRALLEWIREAQS